MMDEKRIEELRQLAAIHPKSQWLDECIDEIERLQGVAGRAFIEGAKWWEWHKTGATMWQSDQQAAAEEAATRKMPFHEPIESRLEAEIVRLRAAIWSDDSTETERGRQSSLDAARFVSSLRAKVGRLMNVLAILAGLPDAEGHTHGAELHDVPAMQRFARKELKMESDEQG
jgi:hypothetical protein